MYLLSFFLSIGTTVAIFAPSGKVDEVMLLFMAIGKDFEKASEVNLTNLIGNLSVPATFFEFKDFNSSRSVNFRKLYLKKINLYFYFHTSLWCLRRFYEGL